MQTSYITNPHIDKLEVQLDVQFQWTSLCKQSFFNVLVDTSEDKLCREALGESFGTGGEPGGCADPEGRGSGQIRQIKTDFEFNNSDKYIQTI